MELTRELRITRLTKEPRKQAHKGAEELKLTRELRIRKPTKGH